MVCCLFGHKDTPSSIYPELEAKIRYAIEYEAADNNICYHTVYGDNLFNS